MLFFYNKKKTFFKIVCTSPKEMKTYFTFVFLCFIISFPVSMAITPTPTPTQQTGLQCWSGVSNPKATNGYPPEQVSCNYVGGGSTCQLTYVATLNLYSMSCTSDIGCSLVLNDYNSGITTSLYDQVKCCTTNGCNADPDLSSYSFGNILKNNIFFVFFTIIVSILNS